MFNEKISVVIPAYNEVTEIRRAEEETARVLGGHPYELIIVDDGSQDRTFAEAQLAAA